MFVEAFIVNVNKRPKPFFLEQHINIVNRVTLQSFWFISTILVRWCFEDQKQMLKLMEMEIFSQFYDVFFWPMHKIDLLVHLSKTKE